jgi:hypothetical protein
LSATEEAAGEEEGEQTAGEAAVSAVEMMSRAFEMTSRAFMDRRRTWVRRVLSV